MAQSKEVKVIRVRDDRAIYINEKLLTPAYLKRHGLVIHKKTEFADDDVADVPKTTPSEPKSDQTVTDGLNAKETIAWIKDCESIELIKSVLNGETRVTVIAAGEKRIKELS